MASLPSVNLAISQFTADLVKLPSDQSLDRSLEIATLAEHELRLLFKAGHTLLDLHIGLIDLFNMQPAVWKTRSRTGNDDHYIMSLNPEIRRENLTPSTVPDINTFKRRWQLFTHGSLSKMRAQDWANVIVAGGSVLACLMALQGNDSDSERQLNEYFHSSAFAKSHIDLFIYGLNQEQAKQKMEDIYKAVCAAAPWKVTCVRRAGMLSIHTTYPFRPLHILLRLYQSPAEVLAGIDIDAACCGYDGMRKVWVNPRCLAALVRQANTVDVTRRSAHYEVKLAKYAERGFEVYLPSLERNRVKPWLYSPSLLGFPFGLSLLLVLEAAYTKPDSYTYLQYSSAGKLLLPDADFVEDLSWAEIPYGQLWNAKEIKKMVIRKDKRAKSISSPFMVEDHRHTHVLFAGNIRRCLKGKFCKECDPEDIEPVSAESDTYIQGPIRHVLFHPMDRRITNYHSFLTMNPGRQFIFGSFRPQEYEDWASEAYTDRNVIHDNHRVVMPRNYPNSGDDSKTADDSGTEEYVSSEDIKGYFAPESGLLSLD